MTAGLAVDVSIFAGLGGSEGDIGCDKGEGAIRRLGSGDFDAGEVAAGARRFDEPCRDEGLFDPIDEVLPALPCLSWLWLELGRLPWRLELDPGRNSWVCRFGVMMGDVDTGGDGDVVPFAIALASRPLRLRLL